MYLRSITVKGFKSFPDRTKLEFGPGVSVIVGPNGSGKSNVTDAVLWALGEQSPGAVRGQSMQDVIFGGAPGRQAGGHAEVELILDDSEGSLGLGVPEISILRRLDRNGEGEYRLAGARCRLVDVVELLSDTGLGKEMHSVISQGRVESLVTSKPRERRLLIEEAAGTGQAPQAPAPRPAQAGPDPGQPRPGPRRRARGALAAAPAQAPGRGGRAACAAGAPVAGDSLGARARRRPGRTAPRWRPPRPRPPRSANGAGRSRRSWTAVAKRREAAEAALAARSAQREELSRRAYAARSAAERIGYRAESARAAAASVEARVARYQELLATLQDEAAADQDDPEAARPDRRARGVAGRAEPRPRGRTRPPARRAPGPAGGGRAPRGRADRGRRRRRRRAYGRRGRG